MALQVSTGVLSQRYYPGVGPGPLDDCWALADLMALHAIAPEVSLPSVTTYRVRAGVPDTATGSEGGSLEDSLRALRASWHGSAELFRGTFAAFLARLKAGAVASASVLSGSLPSALRFGFLRNHRVMVFWSSTGLKVLNPLAPPHSRAKAISAAALQKAMADYVSTEPACALLLTA
jgi:hypothetical protein